MLIKDKYTNCLTILCKVKIVNQNNDSSVKVKRLDKFLRDLPIISNEILYQKSDINHSNRCFQDRIQMTNFCLMITESGRLSSIQCLEDTNTSLVKE